MEDYISLLFLPFATVVSAFIVALFVKLVEHVKKPKRQVSFFSFICFNCLADHRSKS